MGRITVTAALCLALGACMQPEPEAEAAGTLSSQSIPAAMQGVHAKQLFGAKAQGSEHDPAAYCSYA